MGIAGRWINNQLSPVLCCTCARRNRVSVQVALARGSSSDPGALAQNLTKKCFRRGFPDKAPATF